MGVAEERRGMVNSVRKLPASVGQLLLVTLLGLPLISPLLHWTAVACTHDGHLHVHRIAAMRHAWESGIYFTRWLPDLAFGYGYPFFVYREPAPLYAALLPHLLGLPLPAASNLFYALCILAAGWFMFLWVRDILGTRAGFVAAVAYMAAPYVLLDALVRGNAPESLALPLFPFLMWLGRRWLLQSTAVSFFCTTLGLAFLSLSHNISTLIFVPTLFIYLLSIAWLHKLTWRVTAIRLLLLFGLGLGMTFFYSAGALLEMDQVTLQQSTTTRNNDFHFNFASLAEIFAPVTAEDPKLLNPPLPIRLGWMSVALAFLGVSSLFWKGRGQAAHPDVAAIRREQHGHIILMVLVTAVYLFMALPASLPLWENLPLIDFVQFPWRFIGRAALPIAFLAAAPFTCTTIPPSTRRTPHSALRILFYAALTLLILEAIPTLYPRSCNEELFPTILTVHNYEHGTGLVGVDPEGSYFPRTVEKRPQESPLEADYLAGQTPQRLDLSAIPAGAVVDDIGYGRLSAAARINSPEPFTARYLSFAFPGWTATVDSQKVLITPSDPEGLITFPVPSGVHTIAVRWGATPLRSGLTIISLLAMIAALLVTFYLLRGQPSATKSLPQPATCLRRSDLGGLLILAVALLGVKLLIDRVETPLRRAVGPIVDNPLALQGGDLHFDGFSLSQPVVSAGESFDIDLAWTAVASTGHAYQSNVWLADAQGLLWSDKETQRPRIYEDAPLTWEWQPGQWAWDSREVAVLPGTPPGNYDLILTLFDVDTLQPLTLFDDQGAAIGPSIAMGQIEVTFPQSPPQLRPQFPLETAVPDSGLTLLGYNQDRATAVPGEQLLLTLFWERQSGPMSDSITLQLQNEIGETVYQWQRPLLDNNFDLNTWPTGQRLRGQYDLRLPPDLPDGEYQFVLQEAIPLGKLTINAPDRVFEQPEVETAVNALFDDQIELTGYTLHIPQPDQVDHPLRIDIIWQALAEIPTSYRIFVHLVDETGQIVAQSDGEPANWARPTTGWVTGEYIFDSHELTLPEELATELLALRVGLYDPLTGQRLIVNNNDFIEIQWQR